MRRYSAGIGALSRSVRLRENAIVRDEIRILGPLEIIGARGPLPLGAPKERRLLAALVAEAGKTRSSDALANAIWGESPPRSAPKLLQVYISKLRKRLPPQAGIRTHGSGYALELRDGVLDAARFERLLKDGREAALAGNPALAASTFGRALTLWRGEAYGELADEDFVRAEAQRLEELRLVALEERFAAELELGRHADLLAELGSLAESHPLRERLQAQLMLALYRSGRQAEALDRYAETRRHLHDELGLEPGADLRELQRRILQQDPTLAGVPAARETMGVSLPAPLNPLLGRERALTEIVHLIQQEEVRLLVLTGAGGSGKTRLGIEAARRAASSFANGAVFVGLAPIHDTGLVLASISETLGIEPGSEPLETVVAMLGVREVLLVLDNFEHLREAAPVLVELISRTPGLTLLVTSRVVLHLSGEHVYPVEPLAEDAASELFLMRAREADAHFELSEADTEAVRRICRRLDGLPLAIELAAGRTRMLTPAELLAGLERRLPLLTGGPRDLPARQRTLRSTLEWSFDLLDELEQRDLARLSVFRGRFTVESAEYVAETTLERLSSLVDHNLLIRTVTPHGSRYVMLETIHELASEQLDTSDESDDVQRRLAERMIVIAEVSHLSEDADEPFHWPVGVAEPEDLRAALDWAVDSDPTLGLELACAYENFWGPHAPSEGVRRVGDLLARAEGVPPRLRARALRNIAGAAHQERDFDVAVPRYEESLRIFSELGDVRGATSNRMRLAYCAIARQEFDLARELLHGALRDARGEFPLIQLQGVTLLGHLAFYEGRLDDADAALDQGEKLLAAHGWKWYEAVWHRQRLAVALERGNIDKAERHGRAGLAINVEQKHAPATTQDAVAGLARVAFLKGDLERAGLLWGAILVQGEHRLSTLAARWREELRRETRPQFVSALERGRALDLWEAAALALSDGRESA